MGFVLFRFGFDDICLARSNSLFTVLAPFLSVRNGSPTTRFTKAKVRKVYVRYHEALKNL